MGIRRTIIALRSRRVLVSLSKRECGFMDRDQGASRREDSRIESRGSSQGAVLMIPPEKAVRFEIIRTAA